MRVKKHDLIPGHVRQFCEGEFRSYPLRDLEYKTALLQKETIREEGGNRGLDLSGVVSQSGTSSPIAVKFERMEQIMTQRDVLINQHCCSRVQGVMATMDDREYDVLEAYYWQRKSPPEIERLHGISERTQRRIRNELVARLAIAWGMM